MGVQDLPVARDEELRALHETVTFGGGPRVALIVGEAGIGKTTLWRAAIETAFAAGIDVRATAAAESEASFALAPIADLLRDVGADRLAVLPPPQRHAVEGALMLADPPDKVHLHAVAAGFARLLHEIAAERPLLLAVDDVQWFDRASADVLAYAARRADGERIRFLLTRRAGTAAERPPDLGDGVQQLRLEPFSFGALQRLLLARGFALSGLAVRRIHEASGGNPFFAIELAAAAARHSREDPLATLPVPDTLAGLLDERVGRLPPEAETAVLAAAFLADPLVEVVRRATGGVRGLETAEAAGMLVRDRDRIRLAHPLVGTAVRARASAPVARRLHLRLAELVESKEERARHLALGSDAPDEAVAAVLDEAARGAAARGATTAAAELARDAFFFSDVDDRARRRARLLAACAWHMDAGLFAAGHALLLPELDAFPPGPERAEALFLELNLDRRDRELGEWQQALAEAQGVVRARILSEMSFAQAAGNVERLDEARRWAEEALSIARVEGDHLLELEANQSVSWIAAMQGDHGPVRRLARLPSDERLHQAHGVDRLLGVLALWRGDVRAASQHLQGMLALAEDHGQDWAVAAALLHLFELEVRIGDRAGAGAAAERFEAAAAVFRPLTADTVPRTRAFLAALDGDLDEVRRAVGEPGALGWQELAAVRTRGVAELFAGAAAAASRDLQLVYDRVRSAGVRDPGVFPVAGDLAEALLAAGRPADAADVVEALEASVREEPDHAWAAVVGARSRGLLLTAAGEHARAEDALRAALERHRALDLRLDEARATLALGMVLRRLRRLREARATLEQAATRFEQLGARPLAARARDELASVAGRRTASGLTATEERVAELVAKGLSNREVAATLVVSAKSVERHLTRIYAKLGVRTRAELARRAGESGGISRLPEGGAEP